MSGDIPFFIQNPLKEVDFCKGDSDFSFKEASKIWILQTFFKGADRNITVQDVQIFTILKGEGRGGGCTNNKWNVGQFTIISLKIRSSFS